MLDKYSFIYLLVSEESNIFKIGKADNIINRHEVLKGKWGNFNLNDSYQIKCNKDNIFKLEKTLHYIFKDYNVIQPGYQHEGYTEWFDIKCYNNVIDLLNNLQKINSDIIEIQQGIKLSKKNKINTWQSLSKEEKKEKTMQNKRKMQQKNLKTNIQNATMLIKYFNDLKSNIIFFNKEQNLIVLKNGDIDRINSLFHYQTFYWIHDYFNFITSSAISYNSNLSYLDLRFDYFEEEDRISYEEIDTPYKIIMTFFNKLYFENIETDINVGLKHKKEQLKLLNMPLDNFFY